MTLEQQEINDQWLRWERVVDQAHRDIKSAYDGVMCNLDDDKYKDARQRCSNIRYAIRTIENYRKKMDALDVEFSS